MHVTGHIILPNILTMESMKLKVSCKSVPSGVHEITVYTQN